MTDHRNTLNGLADGKEVEEPKSPPWAGAEAGEWL